MNAPIELIKELKKQLEANSTSGDLYFLAIVKRYDLQDKWDVLISAERLTADKSGFETIREILLRIEPKDKVREIASIIVLTKDDNNLDGFRNIIVDYTENPSEFSDMSFGKLQIGHIYIFKSDLASKAKKITEAKN